MKLTLRTLHRWFGLVSALLLMGIAITALVLQIELWVMGKSPPGQPPKNQPAAVSLPAEADLVMYAQNGLLAANNQNPNMKVRSMTITFTGSPTVVFDRGNKIDAVKAEFFPIKPKPTDWHYIMQDIHAGYFLGNFGRVISCLLALALLLLSHTGLSVYWDMFKRRRKQGRKGVFWK